jgi:dephospho-CoA kinase
MEKKQAIFVIGSPGSGKDVLIRDITSNYGIVEFTSSQIDEMLSNDVAFKRAKPEKQNSLLETTSIIVTANSFDLGFVITKEILEAVGYTTHLIFVEADLSVAVDRLRSRKNLTESLARITVGNSNKQSILGLFESKLIVDNSVVLNLIESRNFISDILDELSFKSELTLEDLPVSKLKKKLKNIVPGALPKDITDTRSMTPGTWSTFGGCAESVDFPFSEITPTATGPMQKMVPVSVDSRSDQDKERTKSVLNKIKKINFKQVIPHAIDR